MKICLTDFASKRHFDNPEFAGTKIPCTVDLFSSRVSAAGFIDKDLVDGYAPFCKHIFIGNFVGALSGVSRITLENREYLNSGYFARREGELPILTRWFDSDDIEPSPSLFLDLVLYSAEHLATEGIYIEGDWGIVSINSAESADESPMPPITMMRNALGKQEGGSGVPLDREEYERSVSFWSEYAVIR